MMKRLTWFVGGVAAGALGAGTAKRKVKAVATELTPVQVAKRAGGQVRRRSRDVAEAVREGRRAMRLKEIELRARADGTASTLADELADLDGDATVYVDGRPVEPAQVIVLRPRRDAAAEPDATRPPASARRRRRPGSPRVMRRR